MPIGHPIPEEGFMRKLWLFLIVVILSVSCQALDENQELSTIREEEPLAPSARKSPTQRPSSTATLSPTPSPTITSSPTLTSSPTPTIQPTITNTRYPTEDLSMTIAKNDVAVLADNEVEIEILRIFISDREGLTYLGGEIYEGKQTVFEIIFRVTNNRGSAVMIDFFQTQVWVNETQVDFGDYRQGPGPVGYWFIDDDFFGDAYYAESSEIGGLIVGIEQPAWDQINSISVWIPAGFDHEGRAVTDNFVFEIDPSAWGFEPLPEALEDLPRQGGVY